MTVVPDKLPETPGPQAEAPHTTPALAIWHPALPSHFPVLAQTLDVVAHMLSRGFPPDGMLEQVPCFPVNLQLWQPPVQALLQHTPSDVQKLLKQSPFTLHASPFGSLPPHRLLVIRQVSPFVQSLLFEQVFRHEGLVLLHLYGSQDEIEAAGHDPLPSQ